MALIYIVEDDQNIREIESFALKNSGYTIMDFECAKDFYHQLAEKVPDCILLDIMLPDEDIFLDGEKHMVYVKDEPVDLTFKEYELLKLLIQNQGIVMSRDVIMERIWGIDFEGESRTLDVHIKTLRQKLKNTGTLIKTVRNVGYMIE